MNKNYKQRLLILIFIIQTVLLSACAVKTTPLGTYMISATKVNVHSESATQMVLEVSQPLADPGYTTNNMLYLKEPYQLKSFSENQWVAPPAGMLLESLVQGIRAQNYFLAVITQSNAGKATYRLDTRLINLQQEFFSSVSKVRLEMQATLVDLQDNQVLASQRFSVLTEAPGNNPQSGATAANQAAAIISKKIAHFVIHFAHSAQFVGNG